MKEIVTYIMCSWCSLITPICCKGKKTIVIHNIIILYACQWLCWPLACCPALKCKERTDQVEDRPAGVAEPSVAEHCMPTKRSKDIVQLETSHQKLTGGGGCTNGCLSPKERHCKNTETSSCEPYSLLLYGRFAGSKRQLWQEKDWKKETSTQE